MQFHAGFKAAGSGGILDDPMFVHADFTATDYPILSLGIHWAPEITRIGALGNHISIGWHGGRPPYQVQWRSTAENGSWMNSGEPTEELSATIQKAENQAFYRVISEVLTTP